MEYEKPTSTSGFSHTPENPKAEGENTISPFERDIANGRREKRRFFVASTGMLAIVPVLFCLYYNLQPPLGL